MLYNVYLLFCRNSSILAHVYFRFIKVNFPFANVEGERRKLSFPSKVDNFRDTFGSPQYSFIASHDAKNELKNRLIAIIVVIGFVKERFHNAVEIDILGIFER